MTIRPIAFTGAMVSALLDGRKAQTRRVLKPQPYNHVTGFERVFTAAPHFEARDASGKPVSDAFPNGQHFVSPYPRIPYSVGDLLYVREEFEATAIASADQRAVLKYLADGAESGSNEWPARCRPPRLGKRQPPMFLPREYSRLTLKVTDVRVERVQEISEADAQAEGLAAISKDGKMFKFGIPDRDGYPGNDDYGWHWADWEADPRDAFRKLWDSINAPRGFGWQENPWVVADSFSVIRANVDQLPGPQAKAEDTERERSGATTRGTGQ